MKKGEESKKRVPYLLLIVLIIGVPLDRGRSSVQESNNEQQPGQTTSEAEGHVSHGETGSSEPSGRTGGAGKDLYSSPPNLPTRGVRFRTNRRLCGVATRGVPLILASPARDSSTLRIPEHLLRYTDDDNADNLQQQICMLNLSSRTRNRACECTRNVSQQQS